MKNILVFSTFYKPHLGGVEKYVENFYKRLPNFKTTVVTSKYQKTLSSKDKDQNLNIIRIDSYQILKDKYYIPTLQGLKEIIKLLKINSSDETEIHTHTRFYLTNLIASILARKYKIKHYHFEHGSSFVQDGSALVRLFAYLFDNTLGKYILNKSDLVFPISEGVRKFLEKNYKNAKLGPTLYNSYEIKNKNFKTSPKPAKAKLLFVGRLVKSKGVYELIEATKILKDKNFPFTLTLIGDGTEKVNLEKYVFDHNLTNNVFIKGKLPYEETQLEFPKYDIFINPSYTEGLPTTVLEALFNNLLIVATNVGGTNEILPEEMLINIDDLSPKLISENIKKIFKNWEKLQTEFESIYKDRKEKFSWNENIKKYLEY